MYLLQRGKPSGCERKTDYEYPLEPTSINKDNWYRTIDTQNRRDFLGSEQHLDEVYETL